MQNNSDIPTPDPDADLPVVNSLDMDSLDELLRSARWPNDATDPLDRLLRLAKWPEPVAGARPGATPRSVVRGR